ncbi:LuxR family transcriptional regulator [Streptomyces palmae]|uniref:LuxR family transcriptional regulator n=1 Tax=Streptomyces palmae TaxID=1701085 RepID=UPI001FD818C6|nr:LuxR family transcriptional regulator [Streptomyces palmae]
MFETELLRQENFRRLRLRPLSPEGVALLLADRPREATGEPRRGDPWWAASGGNPLLLRALLAEHQADPERAAGTPRPAVGGPFARAVLACLHRGGLRTREIAEAVAVLGEYSTPDLLTRLLGTTAAAVAQRVRALDEAGVFDGYEFRHPVAAATVREQLPPARRAALHRAAAGLLHAAAMPAPVVAPHLLAARHVDEAWSRSVLQGAAEDALAEDRAQLAVDYLELAAEGCRDDKLRAAIDARITQVTWRLSPFHAEQRLAGPVGAQRAGLLPGTAGEQLVRMLLLHGRTSTAAELAGAGGDPHAAGATLLHTCPRGFGADPTRSTAEGAAAAPPAAPALLAAGLLWLPPDRPADPQLAAEAEQALDASPLVDATLPDIVNQLRLLAFAGRPERAAVRARRLYQEAGRRGAPGWQSLCCALLAETALLRGRFPEAEEYGRLALGHAPTAGRSGYGMGPVVTRVLALTAMGRYAEAGALLAAPVPDESADGLDMLPYLRARGRYHLAANRRHAALNDFLGMGRLAARWDVDRPALLPWRLDAAEALLELGREAEAKELLEEQHAALHEAGARTRGTTRRLLAAVAPARDRRRLLTEAVDELYRSGDVHELARTLADLADTHRAAGDEARAAMMRRRVWRMAGDCGAQPLRDTVAPARAEEDVPELAGVPGASRISGSERRVAALAAHGYTNREIAAKLFITVSTVEQHLTRVYRKLKITRRQELPPVEFKDSVDESA